MFTRGILCAFAVFGWAGPAQAQSLDDATLKQINEFATTFCDEYAAEGSRNSLGGGVEAQAKLNNAVGRLLGIAVTGEVRLDSERYVGLPREHVMQDRQRVTNCKMDLWEDLKEVALLGGPAPARPSPVIRAPNRFFADPEMVQSLKNIENMKHRGAMNAIQNIRP